jgi:hypothetical protein
MICRPNVGSPHCGVAPRAFLSHISSTIVGLGLFVFVELRW